MKVSKKIIIFLVLIVFGAAAMILLFYMGKPGPQQKALPDPQIRASSPDTEKDTRKKLVIDLDNLDVIKKLEQSPKTKESAYFRKDNRSKANDSGDARFKTRGPTRIYENEKFKIEGGAGLTEFPTKMEPLDKMKDKLEVNGNITVDF